MSDIDSVDRLEAILGKTPPAVNLKVIDHVDESAMRWLAAAPADIKPAKMFADHVKLNKDKGLGARIAGAFVSVPGLMQRGLDKDYKDNLY